MVAFPSTSWSKMHWALRTGVKRLLEWVLGRGMQCIVQGSPVGLGSSTGPWASITTLDVFQFWSQTASHKVVEIETGWSASEKAVNEGASLPAYRCSEISHASELQLAACSMDPYKESSHAVLSAARSFWQGLQLYRFVGRPSKGVLKTHWPILASRE